MEREQATNVYLAPHDVKGKFWLDVENGIASNRPTGEGEAGLAAPRQ